MITAPDGIDFKVFTLENSQLKITLTDWGASWLSCLVKMGQTQREVLVSCPLTEWHKQTAYFGATIGRYANRIANARYRFKEKTITLSQNQHQHQLHGGIQGADKQRWQAEILSPEAVKFSRYFADNEEGFPGNLMMSVEYHLIENQLIILFQGQCDQDCPINFTNHAYFNLQQSDHILDHQLQIDADVYLPVDQEGIPTTGLTAVAHTGFDFLQLKAISQDFLKDSDQQKVGGYDHAFLLSHPHIWQKNGDLMPQILTAKPVATLISADNKVSLELSTSKPALQIYTGNFLGGQPKTLQQSHQNYAGIALEPEFLPDSPNHPEWWHLGAITPANQLYQHFIAYRFSTNE